MTSATAADPPPERGLDATLAVVRAGSAEQAAEIEALYAPLVAADPRSAVVVTLVDGRPLPGVLRVGDHEVPPALIATRLAELLRDRPPLIAGREGGQLLAVLGICQDDPAVLRALAEAGDFDAALALVEAVEWGTSLDGLPHAGSLRAALASLDPAHARLVSLLGLSDGGLIHAQHPLLLTAGGVDDPTFREALGRDVDGAAWTEALMAAARAGIFTLWGGYPDPPPAFVTPLQALALREHLREWAGDDVAVAALQLAWDRTAITFTAAFDEAFAGAPRIAYDNFLHSSENALARALETGLRRQDDALAARALNQLLVRPIDGTQAARHLLHGAEAVIARYDVEALPDLRSVLLAWQARDQVDRELWPSGLRLANAALAVEGASWRVVPRAHVLVMAARALWRSARTAEAEETLAEAARAAAGTDTAGAVASACADFAQYLELDAAETQRLRERVGAPPEAPTPIRLAVAAEAEGRLGDALEHWLENLRVAQTAGSRTSRAFALEELGRFFAVFGAHDGATHWLGLRLQAGAELGLDPEQPLRYLGLSAERAGRWEEARAWLQDALAAARVKEDVRAEGECLYELALVAIQSDEEAAGAGREELREALRVFERTGPATHVGDCYMLLAQVELAAGAHEAARVAAARMNAVFAETPTDAERLERAAQVTAMIAEQR